MSAVRTRTRSPEEYLAGLRDGREVWYRGERVEDVTAHPELGIAARHGALDFHGPSAEQSPFYTLPRSGGSGSTLTLGPAQRKQQGRCATARRPRFSPIAGLPRLLALAQQ